jgi:protein-S-isoprenylcysteine O-methyltransferase Ste14
MKTGRTVPSRSLRAASDFEVRHRSLISIAIYLLAFAFWALDRRDVAGFIGRLLPATMPATQISYLIAALPALLAAWISTWTCAYLPSGANEGLRLRPGDDDLVTDGPYRFVRHPLYLGMILCFLGFAILLNRLGFAIAMLGITVFVYRLILREEAELDAAFGASYRAYRDAVPRLFPARGKIWRIGRAPNWKQGLIGGGYLWLVAAALVVLAASLKESMFYATLAAAFAVRIISTRLAKHLTSDAAAISP